MILFVRVSTSDHFTGAVDATVHQALAQRYGIQGYPTIKYFKAGKKGSPEDYDGGRTSSDIVAWAEERNVVNLPPPEIVELTGQKVLDDQCEGKQLCIIAFLPHILDSQVKTNNHELPYKVFCRNIYLTSAIIT